MKVATPKSDGPQKKAEPILTLVDDESSYELTKANSASWDVKVNPGEADSASYKLIVRILEGDENMRQLLRWRTDLKRVCVGLNATTVASQRAIILALMRSNPTAVFNAKMYVCAGNRYDTAMENAEAADLARNDNQTAAADAVENNGREHCLRPADIETSINAVITALLPRQTLARAKRALRRDLRKPFGMKVCVYYQHLTCINCKELSGLPPDFNTAKCTALKAGKLSSSPLDKCCELLD